MGPTTRVSRRGGWIYGLRGERPYSSNSRLRTLDCMEAYVRSSGEDIGGGDGRPRDERRRAPGSSHRFGSKHAVTCTFALAFGFAAGLVFRGTEHLALLEWVMVVLAIAGMATGYYIRGIGLEPGDAGPLPRPSARSNVTYLPAARRS